MKKKLLLILVHVIKYYLNECTAELTGTTVLESTIGFNLVGTGPSQFTDNTILLRAVRLDYSNGICNEPKISFRAVIPGQGAQVYSLDLADDGNARIPLDNFCPQTPSKRKRGYIFYDNYKRDILMRKGFHKRTPTKDHPKDPAKSSKSASPATPDVPASPGPKGETPPTPASEPSSPAPASEPSPPPVPEPAPVPSSAPAPAPAGPKAASDKIKVLTFYNEFVLIYYPCAGKFCGDIYSIKNIKNLVKNIDLAGNCDETNAIQGQSGFLYLCYRDVDSSIIWENWTTDTTDGIKFDKTYSGIISNVTVPNKLQSESFGGALFKAFATGPSQYSIIMGSFSGKPNPMNNIYIPPIELFAYFLTDVTFISGPYHIYQNIQTDGNMEVEFQIQACNPIGGGSGGYKCLLSIKSNALDSYTKFVAITFSSTGEQLSTIPFEFDVQHAPDAKTPATLNLNGGGWCIGVYTKNAGLDCLVYDENGINHDTWGIPTGDYGELGGTPNNIMWAVKSFSDPLSWSMYFSDKLVGFNGNY